MHALTDDIVVSSEVAQCRGIRISLNFWTLILETTRVF